MSTSKDSCGFKTKIMKRPNLEQDYIFDRHKGDFIHHETKQSYDEDIELYVDHLEKQLSLLDVSLDEQSEATVCRCTTHWCMVMDKKTLTCSVNDFDCEERQTGN